MKFDKPKVGQMVRWKSQSGGIWKEKIGEVIYSGEPTWSVQFCVNVPEEVRAAPESRLKFDSVSCGIIVKVERKSGVFDYYSPRLTKNFEILGDKEDGSEPAVEG